MTNDSSTLAAIARDVHPDECLLIGDASVAALAEKIRTVQAPRDALLTVDGGDDLDLVGTFEFLANAMITIFGLMKMGDLLTTRTTLDEVRIRLDGDPGLRQASREVADRDLVRMIDRVARR